MTTDYHHPYAMYPGYYYCPPYSGSYPSRDQSHHPPAHHHQQHQQQHQQPAQCSNTYNRTHSGQNIPYHYNMSQRPPYHPQHHPHSSPSSSSSTSAAGYSSCQQQQYSRQSQHQHTPYPAPMVPNFLVSSPGLTPTTLATIEQSFLELQQQQQQHVGNQGTGASGRSRGQQQPITQSGFVPPVVDASGHSAEASQDSQDASSDYSDDWEPVKKRGRLDGGASSLNGGSGSSNVDLIVTSTGATINAAPQRKYTRRNKDEKLSPEEEERRRVRRERNKLAAAKCRQRRVDHTNELVEETEELERQQSALEQEIANLQQEKEQLEFVLQAHQPVCKVAAAQRLQQQQQQQQQVKVKVERPPSLSPPPPTTAAVRPRNLSLNTAAPSSTTTTTTTSLQPEQGQGQYQPSPTSFSAPSPQALIGGHIESLAVTTRPNSLPLIKRNRARILQASNAAGLSSTPTAITPGGTIITTTINTPTSGLSITPSALFCPTLDSIVDGSTGLTPLTGHSCADQVGVATSTATTETGTSGADTVGSPTLISL